MRRPRGGRRVGSNLLTGDSAAWVSRRRWCILTKAFDPLSVALGLSVDRMGRSDQTSSRSRAGQKSRNGPLDIEGGSMERGDRPLTSDELALFPDRVERQG